MYFKIYLKNSMHFCIKQHNSAVHISLSMTILSTKDSNDKNKENKVTPFRAGLHWSSDQNYDEKNLS